MSDLKYSVAAMIIALLAPALHAQPAMKEKVRLITLDPGHFHAALVQKEMNDAIDPVVNIYAPPGDDLQQHIARIESFNKRAENPTHWDLKVHASADYLEQMLRDRPGNVVVIAGNNAKKTRYIASSIDAGLNVLADKPMAITPPDLELLKQSFTAAHEKHVLLYDIMTERYEITNTLQRELSRDGGLFGTLVPGTAEQPGVTKESVHHFYKSVAGSPLKRPAWFFDVTQEGEGIVDVTTHLVDLIQWECFPEQIINAKSDVEMTSARHWPTALTAEQFKKVTGFEQYPAYLSKDVKDGALNVMSNGEFTYKIKGVFAKVSVKWNFEAPAGAGDTHYSMMRGSKANLVIRQGAAQNYRPTLYVQNSGGIGEADFLQTLGRAVAKVSQAYPGVAVTKNADGEWEVQIPEKYKVGHEAHFGQVTKKFLGFLADGRMPQWEEPNMIAKYETIMQAYELCLKSDLR